MFQPFNLYLHELQPSMPFSRVMLATDGTSLYSYFCKNFHLSVQGRAINEFVWSVMFGKNLEYGFNAKVLSDYRLV